MIFGRLPVTLVLIVAPLVLLDVPSRTPWPLFFSKPVRRAPEKAFPVFCLRRCKNLVTQLFHGVGVLKLVSQVVTEKKHVWFTFFQHFFIFVSDRVYDENSASDRERFDNVKYINLLASHSAFNGVAMLSFRSASDKICVSMLPTAFKEVTRET